MTLPASRIVLQGETPYAHERAAIDFTIETLPNSDRFHLWALLELLDPSTGRLYELDMLVLGYSALYHIEIKSGPGLYEGDHQDWYRTPPDEKRPRYLENPYRLANHKAKILADRVRSKMQAPQDCPWVEPLVFLSAEDVHLHFRNHGDIGVVTRKTLLDALQFHRFPGADTRRTPRPVATNVARDVARAIEALGLRPRKGKAFVGSYELGGVVGEGKGYQDREATHRDQRSMTRRARIYLVPQQSSVESRQLLRRAADREASLLQDVRDHPNILRINDYVTDAPLGPTVLFDAFEGAVPLSVYLRQHSDLAFPDRIAIIEQVGRALDYCHRKKVIHGGVSPDAVLIRDRPEGGGLEIRLYNFQLGHGSSADATAHWSALATETWGVYQAPELRENPSARTVLSDVWSLGALTFFVLTGRAPAADVVSLERGLAEARHLDPRVVDDGIREEIADVVRFATARSPIQRASDVQEWLELLLDAATSPDTAGATPQIDPLEARAKDQLGDLEVIEVLGQGATSRVLRVIRGADAREFALKVALDPSHHGRFAAEAACLAKLDHPRIVRCEGKLTFGERSCLLLTLAGSETLHRLLARDGTVSIDLAARYGDDLLSALEHLEAKHVIHRDIKPANLGVGIRSKTAAQLTLFDLSLADASLQQIDVGTAAYRDPFLVLRGAWDHAAERWSAAVTLHEMVTGVRPGFEDEHGVLDPEPRPAVAAERFDASVRDALVSFFQRALAPDATARHDSATEMRRAWNKALDTATHVSAHPLPVPEPSPHAEPPTLTREQLAAISPGTPIEALPLTNRARNALDRGGLLHARDLLRLADNQLSAMRGVGTMVAREILRFRDDWRAARKPSEVDTQPFFPAYRGDDLHVHVASMSEDVVTTLRDAGLSTLSTIAVAPKPQVEALVRRHGADPRVLWELLDTENRAANERARPSTLEGWIDALLPQRNRTMKHPRALYGLEGASAGRLDLTVKELAEQAQVTTAAIYIALGKAREGWSKHAGIAELCGLAAEIIGRADGALPLADAARQLLAAWPHDRRRGEGVLLTEAAALLRVAAELEREAPHGLDYVRIGRAGGWLCASEAHTRAVRDLGATADELAARSVVAGPGEVARVLTETVEGTPLATAAPQRLVEVAVDASEGAARSARLEIYPRGMPAERAVTLSGSLLRDKVDPAELATLIQLRYPDAGPLPPRPALDELLAPHGLQWNEALQRYTRAGSTETTSFPATRLSTTPRASTALPSQAISMEPDSVLARRFDEQLRSAVERRQLRLLGVRADKAQRAAIELGRRLGIEPLAFDRMLTREIQAEVTAAGIADDAIVHEADRLGRAGPAWQNLTHLVTEAARAVWRGIVPNAKPLLLVQPGLIARYRLDELCAGLLEASRQPDNAAIFILVPSLDAAGIPRINGEYALPGFLQSQALWIPQAWLDNKHNEAA